MPYASTGNRVHDRDRVERGPGLEIVSRHAVATKKSVSLLFVHGINVGAWIWEEHVPDHFAAAGFDSHAISGLPPEKRPSLK